MGNFAIELLEFEPTRKTIELIEPGPGMQVSALHKAARAGIDLTKPLIMDG